MLSRVDEMNKLLAFGLTAAGLTIVGTESPAFAGCHEGGVTQHGKIVTRIHRSWCGASPAPTASVFVNNAPPMMAVPYVATPLYATIPSAAPVPPPAPAPAPAAAPVAPTASQQDLNDLREGVEELRRSVVQLGREVKAIREGK